MGHNKNVVYVLEGACDISYGIENTIKKKIYGNIYENPFEPRMDNIYMIGSESLCQFCLNW